jgi:hypothetical protein
MDIVEVPPRQPPTPIASSTTFMLAATRDPPSAASTGLPDEPAPLGAGPVALRLEPVAGGREAERGVRAYGD